MEKIGEILKWAVGKGFNLSDDDWRNFSDRMEALAKEAKDDKFKDMAVATINYIAKMQQILIDKR